MIIVDEKLDAVILNRLKNIYEPVVDATIGIFLIDASIPENRRMFYDYINDYNFESGYKMDFFIPGFKLKRANSKETWNDHYCDKSVDHHYDYDRTIDMENYLFSQEVYQGAVSTIGRLIGDERILHEITNPKVVFFDVTANYKPESLKYNEYAIWEIKETNKDRLMADFKKVFDKAAMGASAISFRNNHNDILGISGANIRHFLTDFVKEHPIITGIAVNMISNVISSSL